MDPEDQIVAQMGLLLTQVRYSRIALEHIERATTRYAGIALSIPGGGRRGRARRPAADRRRAQGLRRQHQRPHRRAGNRRHARGGDRRRGPLPRRLLRRARRRHASAASSSPTCSCRCARSSRASSGSSTGSGSTWRATTAKKEPSSDGPSIMVQLRSLSEVLREVASVFRAAASGGPTAAPAATSSVHTYLDLVRGIANVVDGLILLVPLLIGALASFLLRLRDIQFAIVDMLQFGLRNVLLLRAAVLAIVLDTLSLAGRLAASVVGIVATAVDTVLESVFRVIHAGLVAVLAVVRIVSTGDQEHRRRADALPARRRRRAAHLPRQPAGLPARVPPGPGAARRSCRRSRGSSTSRSPRRRRPRSPPRRRSCRRPAPARRPRRRSRRSRTSPTSS